MELMIRKRAFNKSDTQFAHLNNIVVLQNISHTMKTSKQLYRSNSLLYSAEKGFAVAHGYRANALHLQHADQLTVDEVKRINRRIRSK